MLAIGVASAPLAMLSFAAISCWARTMLASVPRPEPVGIERIARSSAWP
jgi:hypothetical protein